MLLIGAKYLLLPLTTGLKAYVPNWKDWKGGVDVMELLDSEILQKAIADGIIDINTLGKQIEMNEIKKRKINSRNAVSIVFLLFLSERRKRYETILYSGICNRRASG